MKNKTVNPEAKGKSPITYDQLIIGVVVVMALIIVGLVINYFTMSQSAFYNLSNSIAEQNSKIDILFQWCGK